MHFIRKIKHRQTGNYHLNGQGHIFPKCLALTCPLAPGKDVFEDDLGGDFGTVRSQCKMQAMAAVGAGWAWAPRGDFQKFHFFIHRV